MTIDSLRQIQVKMGALLSDDETIPLSFDNDAQAFKAAQTGVVLYDCSHWGLIRLKGNDCSRFLHNQTTNDINRLQPGQGCNTVFVTSTGRTIDLARAYVSQDYIDVLVAPNRHQYLIQWIDRFIFPMDKVQLVDLSPQNAIFTLIGPHSAQFLEKFALQALVNQPEGNHSIAQIAQVSVTIAVGSGLALPGYTIIVPIQQGAKLWQELVQCGSIPLGERVWEQLRIIQGRPMPNKELTEDYNPLEAGLWRAISFEKGCYIGQETIARLNTYQGVKQRLWGIKLTQFVEANTPITVEENKVGVVTSSTLTEEGAFGLGYVKTKAADVGDMVKVGAAQGELISVPFLTHEYYRPQKTNTH